MVLFLFLLADIFYKRYNYPHGYLCRFYKSFDQTSGEDLAGAICHWNPAAIRDVRSKSRWHLRTGLSSYLRVSFLSCLSLSYSFLSFSPKRASFPFIHVTSVHPHAFRSCYFTTCPFASRRPVTRQCRISRGSFLAANVTLLRSTKQTTARR